jgi:exopolysaccharide production protein ExoQ
MSPISAFLFASICTGFWQFVAADGTAFQQLSLLLLVMAAGAALLQKRVVARPLTFTEIVLYAASIVSAVASVFHGADASIQFSIAFLVTLVASSILVRSLTTEKMLNVGAVAILFMQVCSVAFDSQELVRSLQITVTDKGLVRFSPFNNHPNLVGFIFGAGTVLLARRAIVAQGRKERALFIAATMAGWIMLFAASTRASIIALSLATVVAVLREIPPRRLVVLIAGGSVALVVASMTSRLGDTAVRYVSGILEFGSTTRGVSSGGSGRTDLWRQGIDTLVSDPVLLAFGGGLRSSDIANIGFSTEDSYITILLDSGLFLGLSIIGCFLYAFVRSMTLTRASAWNRRELILLPSFFVFILFESIFNRYLVGIGNPMSLFVLLLLMSVADRARTDGTPAQAPVLAVASASKSRRSSSSRSAETHQLQQ